MMSLQQCFVCSKVDNEAHQKKAVSALFCVIQQYPLSVGNKCSQSRFDAAKQRELYHRQGALQHSVFRMRKRTEALRSFSVTPSLPVSVMQLC